MNFLKQINNNHINLIINQLIKRYVIYENIIISCLFKKQKILSYGISKPDIHLHSIKNNKQFSIHAEVDAINNYIKKYNKKERNKIGKIDILTIRFRYNNNNNNIILYNSCICKFCIKSLNKFNFINKIYITNNNKVFYSNFINIYKNINNFTITSKSDRRIFKY